MNRVKRVQALIDKKEREARAANGDSVEPLTSPLPIDAEGVDSSAVLAARTLTTPLPAELAAEPLPLGPPRSAREYLTDHPFVALTAVGVPTAAAILYRQLQGGGDISVRLMHSRVLAQFAVVTTLIGTMVLVGRGPGACELHCHA